MTRRKKTEFVILVGIMACLGAIGSEAPAADQGYTPGFTPRGPLEPFFRSIATEVAEKSAKLAYNYETRPVIGTIVKDFADPAGRALAVGQDLAEYLRAELNRENQFFVYGREQIRRSLGHFLKADRKLDPATVAVLQETIPPILKKPVHLVISGEIQKTPDQQIKATLMLVPLFQALRPVDKESSRLELQRLEFVSPPLSPPELEKAFAVPSSPKIAGKIQPGYGRLIVLSSFHLEKSREQERQYMKRLESGTAGEKPGTLLALKQEELGDPENIFCWLDEQELFTFEEKRFNDRRGYFHNILSGFGADHIWFDADIPEGDHELAFSIFPINSLYKKAVSYPFKIKAGTTTYLIVTALGRPKAEPTISVRRVVDPENKAFPF